MSLNDEITAIQTYLDTAKREMAAFEGGNKSAAARARKSLQSVKAASHTTRKSIIERSKAIPKKTRKPKETKTTLTPVAEIATPPVEPATTAEELPSAPKILKRPRVKKAKA